MKAKAIVGLLSLFLTIPIWYYLLYKMLEKVGASELMWFLFWIYVPVNMLCAFLVRVFED